MIFVITFALYIQAKIIIIQTNIQTYEKIICNIIRRN